MFWKECLPTYYAFVKEQMKLQERNRETTYIKSHSTQSFFQLIPPYVLNCKMKKGQNSASFKIKSIVESSRERTFDKNPSKCERSPHIQLYLECPKK